jgi:polysaccharide biosynthesis/export protein
MDFYGRNARRMKNIFIILLALSCTSCVYHKELVNFPEKNNQLVSPEQLINATELRIQPDDLIRITVHSINPESAAPFNIENPQMQNMGMMQMGNQSSSNILELFNGYLVDKSGMISFPVVGPIKVTGLTLVQLEKTITDSIKIYLKEPVVNVRFLNFKVTVLGEVNSPGTLRLSNQRISVLEAIGMSGDFTSYANRTNVLLIREKNGVREYHRFNFQDKNIFQSPFYYLEQNDVLYVEPTRAKVATVQDPFARGVTYGSAFLSFVTLIIALLN